MVAVMAVFGANQYHQTLIRQHEARRNAPPNIQMEDAQKR